MPTINRRRQSCSNPDTQLNREERQKLYRLKRWRDMSRCQLMTHPECEICSVRNRIALAEDVHHILSPFEPGISEDEKMSRGFDYGNIISLCKQCHRDVHHGTLSGCRSKYELLTKAKSLFKSNSDKGNEI